MGRPEALILGCGGNFRPAVLPPFQDQLGVGDLPADIDIACFNAEGAVLDGVCRQLVKYESQSVNGAIAAYDRRAVDRETSRSTIDVLVGFEDGGNQGAQIGCARSRMIDQSTFRYLSAIARRT